MAHLEIEIIRKGKLYTADCACCGSTIYAHEWTHDNFNELRDAMRAGGRCCPECQGAADPVTFLEHPRPFYAGRYSAPGYLDATDWEYDTNRRKLEKTLRALYS